MKKSLYQISSELLDIASQLEEGELTEDLEKQLSITQEELQTKAINYGFVIKDYDNDLDVIDNEIKRLQEIQKAKKNAKERLKNAISDAMLAFGIEKVECPTLKLSFRKSETLEIESDHDIPDNYYEEVRTVKLDKASLKKDIKDGLEFEGVYIKQNQNLQIK